ncbi:MAG: chorismate synthase [Muribaculaceae bacterium]|nr:chorismate synthase [Muribaculaceae bacterium]
MNTFGKNLTLTTFGESHGPAMGGIIDGFPSGYKIDFDKLLAEIAKRRPGQSALVTARKETDKPEFLSGISPDGITLGTPIGFIVRNADHHSSDYDEMAKAFRPNHADYTYIQRYGIRDHRGGGRQSARETVNWVVAGALALQWLETKGITIESVLSQVGPVTAGDIFDGLMTEPEKPFNLSVNPDLQLAMEEFIKETKKKGDSVGGKVSCVISGIPAGIGEPVADKLHSRLAAAMMSINAAKGFEYGIGFRGASAMGSDTADTFLPASSLSELKTATNYSGGIQGGISNGMPVFFSVAFKPTPTLMQPLKTVDTEGKEMVLNPAGRHDPCVAVRAVPVVKALAALVIADFMV